MLMNFSQTIHIINIIYIDFLLNCYFAFETNYYKNKYFANVFFLIFTYAKQYNILKSKQIIKRVYRIR